MFSHPENKMQNQLHSNSRVELMFRHYQSLNTVQIKQKLQTSSSMLLVILLTTRYQSVTGGLWTVMKDIPHVNTQFNVCYTGFVDGCDTCSLVNEYDASLHSKWRRHNAGSVHTSLAAKQSESCKFDSMDIKSLNCMRRPEIKSNISYIFLRLEVNHKHWQHRILLKWKNMRISNMRLLLMSVESRTRHHSDQGWTEDCPDIQKL